MPVRATRARGIVSTHCESEAALGRRERRRPPPSTVAKEHRETRPGWKNGSVTDTSTSQAIDWYLAGQLGIRWDRWMA